MAEKRYYWLKLQEDFFSSVRIKRLRKIAGGDTYTIIYLKMQLLSIRNGGMLKYSGYEPSFAEELAIDIDEEPENVAVTLQYLSKCGLIETSDHIDYLLPFAAMNIGSEGSGAKRVRDFRERQKALSDSTGMQPPKTNAERQRAFRAKQKCAEKQHIPMVDDDTNRKRYGGNYFLVCQRERYQCALCGSIENLCVHHIDNYDEHKPENNALNKLILLCRKCHSNVHYSDLKIPEEVLDSIGYFDETVTCNEICNASVTEVKQIGNGEIEKEIEKEKDIDSSYEESCREAVASDSPNGKNSKGKNEKRFAETDKPYRAAKWLSRAIMDRMPKRKPITEDDLQRWASDIDKLHRIDGYDDETISDVLIFSQRDAFWQSNILSGKKFREKFVTLMAHMERDARKQSND